MRVRRRATSHLPRRGPRIPAQARLSTLRRHSASPLHPHPDAPLGGPGQHCPTAAPLVVWQAHLSSTQGTASALVRRLAAGAKRGRRLLAISKSQCASGGHGGDCAGAHAGPHERGGLAEERNLRDVEVRALAQPVALVLHPRPRVFSPYSLNILLYPAPACGFPRKSE
ncbi:hypothetical protein PHLGIDRAFT_404588 [Phlebiopsis gigantea 11061_1 CR5-6]|uniref:Uncharacterized protein n=1 Tax=Phlebiopsis gigantea (strain 11061_1 CR5-6) TaxID=745531 RepID=A0A0C3PMJ2_PHLG1|nr:hypothetical protein PHLGIDRAFT_404588 [Phlebiopsis gigantea 11061_1 CR5-6]